MEFIEHSTNLLLGKLVDGLLGALHTEELRLAAKQSRLADDEP